MTATWTTPAPTRLLLSSPGRLSTASTRCGRPSTRSSSAPAPIRADNLRPLVNSPSGGPGGSRGGAGGVSAQGELVSATGELEFRRRAFWAHGRREGVSDHGTTGPGGPARWGSAPTSCRSAPHLDWHAGLEVPARPARRPAAMGGRGRRDRAQPAAAAGTLADELQPRPRAAAFGRIRTRPCLFGPGAYQGGRLRLVESRRIEDVVLNRYLPTAPGTGD
ncbi:hypothetical protein LV779_38870 [Streptomyces thinghirensis]|nr:hypothetical protein [Streptomyces thinghirensis]